jgi:hypothetical protein
MELTTTPDVEQRPRLVASLVGGARWVLPWIMVMALSASLSYAMNVAVGGGTSAQSVAGGGSAPVKVDASCDTRGGSQYVGLNTWISTPPGSTRCIAASALVALGPAALPAACETAPADGDNERESFLGRLCGGTAGAGSKP